MAYRHVLFDLDGTLTDPAEGITGSVAWALERSGVTPPPREELYRFIGPPLVEAFMEFYGFSEERARKALEYYRERYVPRGIYEVYVYSGIPEMLKTLRDAGLTLAVATSKPEVFARSILSRFGLDVYFDFIGGSTLDERMVGKADIIRYVLNSLGADTRESLMVGDRRHDAEGARANGIDCIGVLFGYGSREELEHAGVLALAADPGEAAEFILRRRAEEL